ncbi:DUF5996 family protein [Mucilaginibacter polytrichastri]|nr:DUF5996 family protein [Mucilaginibacter polytrichastri]
MNEQKIHLWPQLDYQQLKETIATVHMWTQMVGKVRLIQTPWINHSWHVTLYVSPIGLTTGSIPYHEGSFQIDLDFIDHQLHIFTSAGKKTSFSLGAKTIAGFYIELMDNLKAVGIDTAIYAVPNEVEPAIPFLENHIPCTYHADVMHNYWQALVKINNVFTKFRAVFDGKCSPVHFFWGAFDLAVTRFSGRKAPLHPGGAPNIPVAVMQEAYSQEVSSCGFWPGSDQYPNPAFYAYCYPTPNDFGAQKVAPEGAFYSKEMGEYLLPYHVVQQAADPEASLLGFLQTTYNAAAVTGNWDKSLQCDLSGLKTSVE